MWAAGPPDVPGPAQTGRGYQQIRTTVVFINQIREKVGVIYGSPETTTGAGPEVLRINPAGSTQAGKYQAGHRYYRKPHPG